VPSIGGGTNRSRAVWAALALGEGEGEGVSAAGESSGAGKTDSSGAGVGVRKSKESSGGVGGVGVGDSWAIAAQIDAQKTRTVSLHFFVMSSGQRDVASSSAVTPVHNKPALSEQSRVEWETSLIIGKIVRDSSTSLGMTSG
jgi:hypothetical protein